MPHDIFNNQPLNTVLTYVHRMETEQDSITAAIIRDFILLSEHVPFIDRNNLKFIVDFLCTI